MLENFTEVDFTEIVCFFHKKTDVFPFEEDVGRQMEIEK